MTNTVPKGWIVADKTGSGNYGIANDISIIWPTLGKPIVLAIYTVQNKQNAKSREDIVALTTRIIFNELAKKDPNCNLDKIQRNQKGIKFSLIPGFHPGYNSVVLTD